VTFTMKNHRKHPKQQGLPSSSVMSAPTETPSTLNSKKPTTASVRVTTGTPATAGTPTTGSTLALSKGSQQRQETQQQQEYEQQQESQQ
jgi:hypothetical protein